jgi:hypothetical protein
MIKKIVWDYVLNDGYVCIIKCIPKFPNLKCIPKIKLDDGLNNEGKDSNSTKKVVYKEDFGNVQ